MFEEFQDEDSSLADFDDDGFSDSEPPQKKHKSMDVSTPRGSVQKAKATPKYKQRLTESTVPPVASRSSTDISILSQLEKQPQFYSKLAAAVRPFPCLYHRCDPSFRTDMKYRQECWTKVAKDAAFIGNPQEIEAEWRCLENNYRKWRQEKAKKQDSWDKEMDDVFREMKWLDRGLISWVEKSPLMVALAALHEKHVARAEFPSRRRQAAVADTSDVFDVPEKEPGVSPARLPRSARRVSALGSMEFPKATPQKKCVDVEIASRLRESLRPRRSTVEEESGMSPFSGSRASAVFDLSARSSPDMDWSERSDEI